MPIPTSIPAYDWIAYQAANQPEKLALLDLGSGRRLSYSAFDNRIGRLAAALRAEGKVGPGDRVMVLGHNSSDVFEIQFACARLGAIFVPVNWRLAPPELVQIARHAAPTVLYFQPEFAETAAEMARQCGTSCVATFGAADSDHERMIAAHAPLVGPHPITHDDVATILYTSGTTGMPKGVTITHGMRFWQAINLAGPTRLNADTVCLTVLPLFHVGGLDVYANPCFHFGGTVLLMRGFDAAQCLRLLTDDEAAVTLFIGVPAMYLFMAQLPEFQAARFHPRLRATVGAAPIPLSQLRQWEARGLALQMLYGMTETCGVITALDGADVVRKAGSSGKPALHMALRLVTPEGREAGTGETGEVWVKGPSVTPGYWRNEAANAAAFSDGWLRTGDAATRDAEGFITIVDRWKDMYISGGENVYPAEVEDVLYQIPGIAEVAVIGIPDPQWGEVGCAVVVAKPDVGLTESDILRHCDGRLARYKQPRAIRFVDALPRNATGKVHKPTLRALIRG